MAEINLSIKDERPNLHIVDATPTVTIADVGVQGPNGLAGPQGPQGIQGVAGPAGSDGLQGIQGLAGPATPIDFEGTGFPEGVVTATVGKTYRDNAGTNGAILWIKATGTGNTGWKVAYGDTGWRNLTDWMDPAVWGTGSTFSIPLLWRMNNNEITIHWNFKNITASAQSVWVPVDPAAVPSGLNTAAQFQYGISVTGTALAMVEYNFYAKHLTRPCFVAGTANANVVAKGTVSYFPQASYIWPAILPGTAA